jgi:myo-inositol-1(or 4)-monophosphatase
MDIEPNQEKLIAFMTEVTDLAGEILMSYFNNGVRVHSKPTLGSRIDIVTDADRASEDLILRAIRDAYPTHDVLTEETLTEKTGSKWLWILDPLDGTVNFAHGYPCFSISIAAAAAGEIVAGMVYDPLHGERFSASKGGGAYLNGQRVRVSEAAVLERCIFSTGFPYDKASSPVNNLAEFSSILTEVQGMRRGGSAALDLSYVACGRLDGFWELKLKPWDMAAGMLLVAEAGGVVTDRKGATTDVFTQSIVATNGVIHERLITMLKRVE